MSRLPTPGSDSGTWGTVLNDYLSVSHATDGTLKNMPINVKDFGAVGDKIADDTAAVQALNAGSPLTTAQPSAATGLYYTAPYYPGAKGRNRYTVTTTATPDGSGNISINHNFHCTPQYGFTGIDATDGKYCTVAALSSSTVTVNVRTAAGAAYTAAAVRVWVELVL